MLLFYETPVDSEGVLAKNGGFGGAFFVEEISGNPLFTHNPAGVNLRLKTVKPYVFTVYPATSCSIRCRSRCANVVTLRARDNQV